MHSRHVSYRTQQGIINLIYRHFFHAEQPVLLESVDLDIFMHAEILDFGARMYAHGGDVEAWFDDCDVWDEQGPGVSRTAWSSESSWDEDLDVDSDEEIIVKEESDCEVITLDDDEDAVDGQHVCNVDEDEDEDNPDGQQQVCNDEDEDEDNPDGQQVCNEEQDEDENDPDGVDSFVNTRPRHQ